MPRNKQDYRSRGRDHIHRLSPSQTRVSQRNSHSDSTYLFSYPLGVCSFVLDDPSLDFNEQSLQRWSNVFAYLCFCVHDSLLVGMSFLPQMCAFVRVGCVLRVETVVYGSKSAPALSPVGLWSDYNVPRI